MEKNVHPAAFPGKRPWIAVFDFSWLVYPSGELPNTVFLHIFFCEPHGHPVPISSLVLCHVSEFQRLSSGSRQFCKDSSVPGCLASLEASTTCCSASRAQSLGCVRSIWAPSPDTFKGWGRRFSKKGRAAAGEVFANRSIFPSRLIIKLYAENMGDLGAECGPHYRKRLTQRGPL